MEKENSCPLDRGRAKLYLDYQKIGKGDYKLMRCASCGLIYTNPLPTEEFLNDFYQIYDSIGEKDNYYRNLKNYSQTCEGRELEELFLELSKKYNFKRNEKILDLGSGGGVFLAILKKNNYQGLGIEISRPAVDFAKKEFNVDCQSGDVSKISFQDSSFGAIFLWDLLEHLREQINIIKKINKWLVKDGYLIIETPNNQALVNKIILGLLKLKIIWPAKWMFGYHHLFLPSEKSLVKLLKNNNFKILEINRKNTSASRIFPWSFKFFIPRIILEIVNFLAMIIGGKNKLLIVAQKN